jgi:hypothetical protein
MAVEETLETGEVTDTTDLQTENQAQAEKSYTQKELDAMMARMRAKYEKQFSDLGDLNELKQLKTNAEKQKQEEAVKRGEFEKVLQDIAAKKDAEIQKRDQIIKEYRVNTPLLNAASKYRSVNPEQVKSLLATNVRLSEEGEVEVVDSKGSVRYSDSGTPLGVDDLVKEFLDANPHFVMPGSSTTNTKSNTGSSVKVDFDLSSLDMSNPAHRQKYKEAKANGLI